MNETNPEIQLISNIVVRNESGQILFIKHDPEDERWWLPGDDLETYQHPDDRAGQLLDELSGLTWKDLELVFVESFRGRRGWHVMFNYRAIGAGEPDKLSATWFEPASLPRTMHGKWEIGVVEKALQN